MLRLLISAILILITLTVCSQRKKLDPISVVVIEPREIKYDKKQQKYIDKRSTEIKYEINNPIISAEYPPGKTEPIITRRELVPQMNVDYFKYAAFIAADDLGMNCVGLNKPCSIIVKELSRNEKNLSLQQIAEKERKQYVLDLTKIEILEKNGEFQTRISVKFYNSKTKRYLIDSLFTGSEHENENLDREGLSLKSDNAIDSAYFNALSKIMAKVDSALNCGWISEDMSLENRRREVLIGTYFNREFDKNVLRQIIPTTDSSINIDISFQAVFNSDSTKFISFFLKEVTDSEILKKARLATNDPQYQLITQSYVVYGVKYNNKWYYSSLHYGTLSAPDQTLDGRRKDLFNELQSYEYGFFKKNSIEPDPAFWETNFFGTVGMPSAYRYPDKDEELNNAPYKGLYVIVAQQLRKERRNAEKLVEDELSKNYINPLIEKLHIGRSGPGYFFIFPMDLSVLLVPITEKIAEDLFKVRYYILIPNVEKGYQVFEWIYFGNSAPKKHSYGLVNEEVGKLTHWNFNVETVEDKNFWKKYVLLKEGNSYKFLKEVK